MCHPSLFLCFDTPAYLKTWILYTQGQRFWIRYLSWFGRLNSILIVIIGVIRYSTCVRRYIRNFRKHPIISIVAIQYSRTTFEFDTYRDCWSDWVSNPFNNHDKYRIPWECVPKLPCVFSCVSTNAMHASCSPWESTTTFSRRIALDNHDKYRIPWECVPSFLRWVER